MKGKREEEGVYGSKKLGVKGCVERYNGSTIKTEKRRKVEGFPDGRISVTKKKRVAKETTRRRERWGGVM